VTILESAIKYAKKGMSVIPVAFNKKPLVKWEPYQHKRASEDEIRGWFKKFPNMNIGIVTGAISDLLVVDTDTVPAITRIDDAIPENLLVPCQRTPSGGKHFLFKHKEGLVNRARVSEGIDIRTEGGYIVVSPSVNGNGRCWSWLEGLSIEDIEPPEVPIDILYIINSLYFYLYTEVSDLNHDKSAEVSEVSRSQRFLFSEGNRDEGLFHIANAMIKGGLEQDLALRSLRVLAQSCDPPFPEKEVEEKVKSAIQRAGRKERNITQELRDWITMSVSGQFKVSDWYIESAVVSKNDKHTAVVALKKLCDQGIIERIGKRTGEYRIIDRNYNVQNWWEDEGKPLEIKFPLDVHELAKIYPGNIILLEGQKSQGKSAFAIEFCRLNIGLYPVKTRYQNVEMSDSELIERFKNYPQDMITLEEWKESVEFVKRTLDWWDLIEPDGLNVVDYLIEYEKSYLIADFIWRIHQKLKTGVALVILQRDPLKPYATGGRGVRDLPRLVLSLIHHKIKLEDVKSFHKTEMGNPTGMIRKYKQASWWKFVPASDWEHQDDEKYKDFLKGGQA